LAEHEKYRIEFMLKMYAHFWDNISRAEDSAWKMFAAYTGIFVGLQFFSSIIGLFGVATLFTLFSFMAVLLMIRANLWYSRNLGLISNLEKEFLDKGDYGRLVPYYFQKKPRFLNKEIFNIQGLMYYLINVGVIALLWSKLDLLHQQIVVLILVICTILLLVYGMVFCWHKDFKKFLAEAKGKEL